MKKTFSIFRTTLVFLIIVALFSCTRNEFSGTLDLQTNNKSILALLKSDTTYSILETALDTTRISGLLNVYGSTTLFAPTNDAFKKYFKRKGISGLSGMNMDTLKKVMLYHIYASQFGSPFFLTGSLPVTTVEGDYIGMDISSGLSKTVLNNTVNVIKLDVPVTNGVVHVIDDVLEPPVNTLYSWIRSQPQYSIMAEAFQQTGVDLEVLSKVGYDSTQIVYGHPLKKIKTIFLETNDVLHLEGIDSFDDLARKYSNTYKTTKQYTNPSDSLNIFVRYHCLEREYFISSIRDEYIETVNPGDFLIFNISPGITINKHDEINIVNGQPDTTNVKVGVDMDQSNIVTKNGIINTLSSVLSVYNPKPVLVISRYNPGPVPITLIDGTVTTFTKTLMDQLKNDPEGQVAVPWLKWEYFKGTMFFESVPLAWGTDPSLKYGMQDNDPYWLELTTNQIFKGTYEVYLMYAQRERKDCNVLLTFDGKQFGDLVNLYSSSDAFGNTIAGWSNLGRLVQRKLGVVKFTELKTHTLKTQVLSNNTKLLFHSLEFRPVK